MSFTNDKQNPSLDDIDKSLITAIQTDIADAQSYQDSVILPTVKDRYEIYYADKKYYQRKFPKLSKISSLVSTDVTDTIEWAMPSLMKVFTGGDEIVTVTGVTEEDDENADIMQQLLTYQLQRQNRFFPILYNWIKDSLITGMGIVKCYWDRKEDYQVVQQSMNLRAFQSLTQQNIQIVSVDGPDTFGIFQVKYISPYYIKNSPVIENILCSELLYSSDAKTLEEANFVAHKKKVTMSYLREKEQQGIYANVSDITPKALGGITNEDQVEMVIGDNYQGMGREADDARAEVTIYECYTKLDWNNDGVLEDMIVTVCDDTILRVEQNYMGRHPFFTLSPTKDPHRIWVKRSYAELIGELQDLKVALTRQIVQNISLTNDPKMILSEEAINIEDYVKGRSVIRKKANHQMQDVAMPMPVNQLSPYTYQFLEYIEGQKENRTGITRYNQGLDSNTLNKMLALDTPIPLIDGTYKKNGDIVAGDILVGSDGKPTKVLVAHPIGIPKQAFKIKFQNGDEIKSGEEHRWLVKVSDKNYSHKSPEFEVLPTFRIFELMETGHHVYIPRVGKVDFTEKDLPIDPYVLGAWLGDGNSCTSRFTTKDCEVKSAFENWANGFYKGYISKDIQQNSGEATTYTIRNTPFRRMLKDLHLLRDGREENCKDNVKHIPDIYLQGSFQQRLDLLRGLMDTDGCIDKNGNAIFCNSQKELIDTFCKLLNSLGIKASVNWNRNVVLNGKKCRDHAHVMFASPYCPVTIRYKRERWESHHKSLTFKKFCEQQRIESIKEIPVEPMRCLTVDAKDSAYCCGNVMTITLNTATGIQSIMGASMQRLELIARMFAETGLYELTRFIVGLNQKFIDQQTVIRLTNKSLTISPDDLQGNFDLVVNAGINMTTREGTQQTLQVLLTAMMQARAAGLPICTPDNIYNIFKKWIENAGFKNYADYITEPALVGQRMMIEEQLKMQVLSQLPPEAGQIYMETGVLPPAILSQLPPQLQSLFNGSGVSQMWGGLNNGNAGVGTQAAPIAGYGSPGSMSTTPNDNGGMVGGLSRNDNRVPQNVPRERGNGAPQQASSVGGF